MDKSKFGAYLKESRNKKNYTQQELANLLFVDVSTVSKWERGVSYPDITLISEICRVLEISEHELIESSKDLEIHIKDFKFDYQMLKKVGSLASSLKNTIFYSDVIPSKQDILKSYENVILEKFFSTINDMEYQTIIRKIIVQDRTIEIEYKDLEMKYQYSFDFSIIDKLLREYFVNRLETENAYYLKYFEFDEYGENKICDGYNDSDPNKEYNKNFINLFNCTKSRNIIPKLARDRFKLDIFAGNEDSQKEFEEEINLEYEEYLTDYNENFGYDLFEGQVNKNLFKVEAIVNSIEKQLCCKIYEIDNILYAGQRCNALYDAWYNSIHDEEKYLTISDSFSPESVEIFNCN